MSSVTSGQPPSYLGVTPPISLDPPKPEEARASETLDTFLHEQGLFEPEADSKKREIVLGKLDALVKTFVRDVSLAKGLPSAMAKEAGGKIFTFGSYRLGVHGRGADIDTLCVVPRHVQRDDFFSTMVELLRARKEVTELSAVPDAYVPVIKMSFSDIPIDLLFARIALPSVSNNLSLADDMLIKNLDERCVRSLNGSRVTDEILRLVPDIPTFRLALRCIKLWAKRRAIYSNVTGFLGGVAWAMLVARVCQLFPNAGPAAVVSRFFSIMWGWQWPEPVLLKPIDEGPPGLLTHARVWNPKIYPADKAHRMPIITPAYPSMCATHNVTASTQTIMREEFARGLGIVTDIVIHGRPWVDLIARHDFFHRYKHYLQAVVSARSEEVHLRWSGMVESRLRQLVMKLELVENLELAHPYISGIERIYRCRNEEEASALSTRTFPQGWVEPTADDPDASSHILVHTTCFYIGLKLVPRQPGATSAPRLDISWPTQEFLKMLRNWDGYDESLMCVHLRHLRQPNLPDDVFEPGEPRTPARPSKRQKSQSNGKEPGGSRSSGASPGAKVPRESTSPSSSEREIKSSDQGAPSSFSSSSSSSTTASFSSLLPGKEGEGGVPTKRLRSQPQTLASTTSPTATPPGPLNHPSQSQGISITQDPSVPSSTPISQETASAIPPSVSTSSPSASPTVVLGPSPHNSLPQSSVTPSSPGTLDETTMGQTQPSPATLTVPSPSREKQSHDLVEDDVMELTASTPADVPSPNDLGEREGSHRVDDPVKGGEGLSTGGKKEGKKPLKLRLAGSTLS